MRSWIKVWAAAARSKQRTRQTHSAGIAMVIVTAVLGTGALASTSVTRIDAFDYDSLSGLPTKQITEPTNSDLCVSTVYGYDSYGNRKSSTASNCAGLAGSYSGSSTSTNTEAAAPSASSYAPFTSRSSTSTYTYNADGSVNVVSANGETESETRVYGASFGQALSLTGPNQLKTQWAYDALGRRTLEFRPDGNGTTWTYHYCSGVNGGSETCPTTLNTGSTAQTTAYPAYVVTEQPVSAPIDVVAQTTGPNNGAYVRTYYDALNRPIRVETQGFDKNADGAAQQTVIYQDTAYDNLGRVALASRPYFSTDIAYVSQSQYDNWGRPITVTAANGCQITTNYNGLTVTTTSCPGQQKTIKTSNVVGEVEQVTDNYSKTLTLAYDAFGNLLQSTDSASNVVKMQYDARGRKYAMQDPDMGNWLYKYDALGNMVVQKDGNAKSTYYAYDRVNRLVTEAGPSINNSWYYSLNAAGFACGLSIGKICEVKSSNGYDRFYDYDNNGRLDGTYTKVGGKQFVIGYDYDANGRSLSVYYPTGLTTQNIYTSLGYLWEVADNAASPSAIYWKTQSMDAEQHVTQQTYGNSVSTTTTYYPDTGKMHTRVAGSGIQDLTYTYDGIGNVNARWDKVSGVNAGYQYDNINRLQSETLIGGAITKDQVITWAYDPSGIGNIQSRTDVGTYVYNPSGAGSIRPHAVSSVTGTVDGLVNPSYSYDSNGNLTGMTATGGSRTVGWTLQGLVSSISQTVGSNTSALAFLYAPNKDRVQETYTKNNVLQRTTLYLNEEGGGLLFEMESNNVASTYKKKCYLNAGGQTFGVVTYDGTSNTTQYWHKDNLNSIVAISDANATAEQLAYEPFGKRRNTNGTTDAAGTLTSTNTERGYTEQEMLDEVGLINMNGRIYDPAISRFVSADPTVQSPGYMQSYNRYSYGFNNPLKYFDPTGFTADTYDSDTQTLINSLGNHDPVYGHIGIPMFNGTSVECYSCATSTTAMGYFNNIGVANNAGVDFLNNLGNNANNLIAFGAAAGGATPSSIGQQQSDFAFVGPELKSWGQKSVGNINYLQNPTRSDQQVAIVQFLPLIELGLVTTGIATSDVPIMPTMNAAGRVAGKVADSALNAAEDLGKAVEDLPVQLHHFATDKNQAYSAAMDRIAKKYGLILDADWNTELLPHLGRHPNEYHEFVLDAMKRIDREANGAQQKFLDLFEQYVKEPVRQAPEMLRKSFWK